AAASVDAISHTARIDRVELEFGAAKVAITGFGTRTQEGQQFQGRAELTGIPVDRLAEYWPLEMAEGGRAWAIANVSHGSVDASAEFTLSTPGNDLAQLHIDRTLGFVDFRDLTVHYMPHMPELLGVSGHARYEGNAIHFDIATGHAVDLTVKDAKADL